MNLVTHNLIIILSFFPIWFFKFSELINFNNTIYVFISYALICIIFTYLISKFKNYKNFFCFILSIIIFYALDSNLSLHRELTFDKSFLTTIFKNIYISSILLVFFIFFFIFITLRKLNENGSKIFLIVIISLMIFNIIDNSQSTQKLNNFKTKTSKEDNLPVVIIIMDEMSGINSFESKTDKGKIFDENSIKFAKKNNMIIYENIYSKYIQSIDSISSFFNFSEDTDLKNLYTNKNKFHEVFSLDKNKLFDLFNDIAVFQTSYINYCENINVKKCETFNPFDKKKYINGFKDNSFTHLINGWKHSGSISSLFIWRLLREYDLIDSSLSPNGEKASFVFLLDKIFNDVISKQFDLIVAHTLVPHKPYGFSEDCSYEGKRSLRNYSNFFSIEQKTFFHNIDRICVIYFIDNFLKKLKENEINYKKIIFLSDHGSRNLPNNRESALKNFLAIKEQNGSYKNIIKESFLQNEIKKYIINN